MNRLVVVLLLLALSGSLAGCTDFSDADADLSIRSIDVAAPEVGAGRLTLAVLVSLHSGGARSGDVNVTVKAHDAATGLLVGTSKEEAGELAKGRTHAVEARISLPRAPSYRLTVAIDEDDEPLYEAALDVRNLDAIEPNVHDAGLRIAASDFRVLDTVGNRTRVQASVYLTNEGTLDSRPLSLQVKARERSTGLVVDEAWSAVGAVRRDATRPVNVTLEMPRGYNYGIEVTLWDGDIIVERGSGQVQFAPATTVSPGQDIVVTTPDLGDLRYDYGGDGGSSKSPGPAFGLAVAALAGLAIALRRRLQ